MSDMPRRTQRRVTITEIADAIGVTPTTVSNAFNRPDQLSAQLRERVLATAARMGYLGPDPAARGMRRGRLPTVATLYADRLVNAFDDRAFVLFLQGVARAADEAQLALTLIPGAPGGNVGPAGVGAAVVDGFIIYSMADDDPLVHAALSRRLPLVVADSPRLDGVSFVGIDDEGAAREAAEHLLALGHRRFAILSGELVLDRRSGPSDAVRQATATFGVNRARLRGYATALSAAGLVWEDVPIDEVAEGIEEEARLAMARLLRRDPRPTAVLAMSDRIALAAVEAARELGLSIPADVNIVGFDDIPDAAGATPPLTTVRQPHLEKGRRAGDLLVTRLRGEEAQAQFMLSTELVCRGSTGPVR